MLIIPPRAQISLDSITKIGPRPAITVGLHGIHGVTAVGIQGKGIVPIRHTPNVITFSRGILSSIVSTGLFDTNTLEIAVNIDGAIPFEHKHIAPVTTTKPMFFIL